MNKNITDEYFKPYFSEDFECENMDCLIYNPLNGKRAWFINEGLLKFLDLFIVGWI